MNNCFHLVFIYINSYKNQNNYSVNEKKSGDFLFLCFDFNYL